MLDYFRQLQIVNRPISIIVIGFSIEDIDHLEVFVKDRTKSAKWHEEIFGLTEIKELEMWSRLVRCLLETKTNQSHSLLMNGKKDTDDSINRMTFRTTGEKFVDFINHSNKIKVFFLEERVTKENLVDHDLSYSIYFDDPDGNKLELTCYDHDFVKSKIRFSKRESKKNSSHVNLRRLHHSRYHYPLTRTDYSSPNDMSQLTTTMTIHHH